MFCLMAKEHQVTGWRMGNGNVDMVLTMQDRLFVEVERWSR
jgi:hypothetical protein